MPRNIVRLTEQEYEALRAKTMAQNYPCDPDCPICGGIGYIANDAQRMDPSFGKTQQCPRLYAKMVRKQAENFGLTSTEIDLLNWGLLLDLGDALQAAEKVKDVLRKGYGMVYLWGAHGQAKTLILKIAVAVSLRDQIPAAYCNMAGLVQHLRAAFDADSPSRESERRLDFWAEQKLLCIDEFNRIKDTDWVKEKRFVLMDRRNVQAVRHETITLIASNDPPASQESYLRSRFEDGRFQVIELQAEDARAGMTTDYLY